MKWRKIRGSFAMATVFWGCTGVAGFALGIVAQEAGAEPAPGGTIAVVDRPDAQEAGTAEPNAFYVGNRPPLIPSPFMKLPIGAIRPEGWVRKQLELQADGFIGRLTDISRYLNKENNAWLSADGEGEHGWEEVPYWVKGFGDTGYVLGDERIIQEARIWLDAAIAGQREDGYFGPRANLTHLDGKPDLWPNMIMLFALQSYFEYSGDARVLDLMTKYFRWEMSIPEDDFLIPFWQQQRAADNLFSIYWLYNRTGEPWLLELAGRNHRHTANWTDDVANWHNVNMCQAFGGPTTYYVQSKDPKHLEASERNYRKIRDMYGQVPGGLFGGDENCRPGYTGPRQAIETCGIVEMMLSSEVLLKISGDPKWADRCEDAAFNTLPASMTPDLKALRYLTAPNLVLSDRHNKSPGVQNRGPMFLMNPHGHRCCQHNMGHGWPYYAEHLWLATPGNGLAAMLYAPCRVTAKAGDGAEVTIDERTRYPFEGRIEFAVSTSKTTRFPLYLRVPGWCDGLAVTINGAPVKVEAKPQSYICVDRAWADGDTLVLELPMPITITKWEENKGCVSVNRGPLTYSLKIGEKYVREGGTDDWPAWEIHPTTPWNYGLVLDEGGPARSFEVIEKEWPASNQPFEADAAPIALRAKAKRIPNWQQDPLGLVGKMEPNPVKSDQPVETVTLIPMGCARLRIAAFPTIGEGPDAHDWPPPPPPLPLKASYVHDSIEAIMDGVEPKNSNDQGIPRFTWWNHLGTQEWVEYTFEEKEVSEVEVYWFDDTGVGRCRVPQSWRLLYKHGDQWLPVENPGAYGVDRDRFNKVAFDPVSTSGLRLDVQLQSDFSGGILEWKVK